VTSNQTVTPSGAAFTGPADPQDCGRSTSPKTCFDWITTLNLRQSVSYQPAGHFWPLQWIVAGIFVAAAVALIGFCLQWTSRRLA
jgi:hypothetical protein